MSSRAVSGFIATTRSMYFLRATYPSLLARMVYQVGSPAIFEGKRFFPLTGTPIPKMLFSRTLLADCEPDPLTVATLMLKSLTTRLRGFVSLCNSLRAAWPVAMGVPFTRIHSSAGPHSCIRARFAVSPIEPEPGDFDAKVGKETAIAPL